LTSTRPCRNNFAHPVRYSYGGRPARGEFKTNIVTYGTEVNMDLSAIDMPVTYIAGTWDAITSAERMRAASAQTPRSRYVELPATHFVPLQLPDRMSTELSSRVDRCRL
jgi:pimeloyl-ACP methyl ester carboxylesterase